MKTTTLIFLITPFLMSCNIYSPLASKSSTDDYLEAAQKCLHDGEYDCAIENYNALPDGETKSQKLCLAYLSKGGMKLTTLINTVKSSSGTMLGELAQALVPWSSDRAASLESAKTHCTTYAGIATAADAGTLLKVLSLYGDCAIRMAKTDVFVATSDTDTTCATASPTSDGLVRRSDFGPDTGILSSSTPGMCKADVSACILDLSQVSSSALTSAGLGDIASANSGIAGGLQDSTTGTVTGRALLRGEALAD